LGGYRPRTVRSDGKRFHLFQASPPTVLAKQNEFDAAPVAFVAFYYEHDKNFQRGNMVDIQFTKFSSDELNFRLEVDKLADRLAENLTKQSSLSQHYIFDGSHLREVSV
jgi:hypothetical protein